MADSYRDRSRRSETPSSSSSGGSHYSSPQYHYTASGPSNPSHVHGGLAAYSYSSAPYPRAAPSLYSSPSPPQIDDPTPRYSHHHRTSSGVSSTGVAPHHSSYPDPNTQETISERASKRHRASKVPSPFQMEGQWADASSPRHNLPTSGDLETGNITGRGSRNSDRSSGSSGYNSPHGYSHGDPHDPYGQRILHSHGTDPSTYNMSDTKHFRVRSSDDEHLEHGPTELPPRTYVGKSPYDPLKKPGKIPGSAMEYLPILEARFDRLENAIHKYVDLRGQQALSNSILPGMETSSGRDGPSSSSRNSREPSRR